MKPIGKSPSYLIRNSYSYCFRMVFPKDLQKLAGKKEMRYSLKTGYLVWQNIRLDCWPVKYHE